MTQDPRLGSYSNWLRANQDKRDTPEWQKVANAYKSLRSSNAAPAPTAEVNPDGTGVSRAIEKGARSVYTGGKQFQANILSEKVTQKTQPNSEYLRRALMLKNAQIPPGMDPNNIDVDRVMQFNVLDLGKGTDWRDDVYKFAGLAVKNRDEYFQSGEEAQDFSKLDDLSQEIASQNQKMRDLVRSPSAQNAADRWEAAPDVKSALKSLAVNPLESIAFFGELAAESIPSIAAGSLATLITGNPTVGAGVLVFTSAPRSYNEEVNSFLTENGVDTTDPQSVSDALDNRELMGKANSRGLTKAAIVSAFEALGMKAGGGILKQSFAQGVTGGAGEGVSTKVLDGEVDWKDVWLEGLAELATAPAEATILRNKKGQGTATKEERVQNNAAAASLAQRLRTLSQNNNYNLKDVKKDGGAKEALEAAHGKITQDMKTIVTNPAVKGYLDPKQAKTLEELIEKYSSAQTAVRQVRNKVKDKVTVENAEAILKLLPAGKERDQIANLMRESNVLTDLFRSGTKGGVSSFTDTFNPFTREDGSYDPSRMISSNINTATAILSAGSSLPIQFGVVAGGRTIDAVTRRRAAIDRFVRKNEGKTPLQDPTGPSLVEAEAERQAQAGQLKFEDDQMALELGKLAQSDKDTSPVGTVLLGTGLDRDGLRAAMSELEALNPDIKALKAVFTDIRKNMDGGTNKIRRLDDIIPIINHHLNTPDTTVQRQANPDQLLAQRAGVNLPNVDQSPPAQTQAQTAAPGQPQGQPQSGNQFTTPENYQAGKSDNNAFVRNLESKLADDTTLAPLDKAQLATALADMQASLGPNPVEAMTEMVEDLGNMGVSQEAIDTYVKPYADRVIAQQARVGRMQAPSDQAPAAPTVDQAPAAPTVDQAPAAPTVDQSPVAPTVDQSPVAPTEEPQTYEAALERITPTNRVAAALERLTTTNRVAGAVDKITEGNMDPASVEAMLNQLEQDNPGIKARILEITGPQQQAAPEASSSTYKYAADTQDGKIERILYPEKSNKVPSNKPALTSQKSPLENIVSKFKRIKRTEKDNMIAYRGSDADTESYKFLDDVLGFLSNERRGSRSVDVNENIDIFESIFRPTIDALNANKPIPEAVEQKFQNLFGGPRQQSEDRPRFAKDLNSASQEPTLQTYVNPLNVPESEINATRLNESPSEADIQKMREGSYKPTKKRNLVKAADYMHQKWKEATGRSEPFEYTPENVDIISTYMATEAANALQSDANAIGWYDRKLKAAKRVVSLVDPRVTQSPDAEAAFDFALAVTSNGQAVADNFQYALEVFRHFMDNGKMPTDTWIKGGERNAAMLEAFDFFNAYQSSGANMPIQDFMDQDFTVKELNNYISRFNAQYGTEIKVPSSEGANSQVKGSYIIGPKIGQGFYQNIRGNYDPLTMDIWWMRMWNRLVGRPFVADPDLDQGRSNVKGALKTVGKLEQKMVNQTLKEMGVGKRDINKDPALFDDFVTKVEKRYQKFYKQYKEENGVNHTKPNFFKKTGTHVKNLKPQLQAQPKGPSERAYMRDVTKAAIAKLSDLGYNIETADFQALMWYPEKQLFRHLGVAPGRGSDNDYLDAAIMLAEGEGIANDQIQEALPDADGDGAVNNQPSTPRGDEGLYRGDGSDGPSQEGPRFNQQPTGVAGILAQRIQGSSDGPTARGAIPDVQEVKGHANHARALVEIGKPGSDYENGIKDQRMVEHLAKAVGVTLKMFNDHNAMLDDGGFTGENRKRGEDAGGVYMRKQNIARSLAPGAKIIRSGQVVRPFKSYLTALHEVAHGIAGRDIDGNLTQNVNMGKNYLTGNQDAAPIDTLEHMIGNLATMPSAKKNKIIKEIMSLQDDESFVGDGVYYGVRPTGPAKQKLELMLSGSSAKKQLRDRIKNFEKYSRSIPELTVDPLIVYLENPKKMKSVAPETAKAIRAFFVNSSKIRFYSHPLAMAFAVVMAMVMKQEQAEEEERQQQQMPPGALNQPMPQGMLSA